jgi:conjugative transposon TraM protein
MDKNILLRRQRKFLVLAPAIIIPVITFIVQPGTARTSQQAPGISNINLKVPNAHVRDEKGINKMAYYNRSDEDSLKLRQLMKKDSVLQTVNEDTNELRITEKLSEIKHVLSNPSVTTVYSEIPHVALSPFPGRLSPTASPSSDVDRLERTLLSMREREKGGNPEMQELNHTLDKLIAAQHPALFADTTKDKTTALPVNIAAASDAITGWSSPETTKNRFYDLETSEENQDPSPATLIEAMIPTAQTLIDGGLLRLELKTELIIHGLHIPAGTPLYGIAHLNNERMLVKINTIRSRDQIFPVALQVIDLDGLAGIYEPGSTSRESVRESAGQGISTIGPSSLETTLTGQAANAGIQLARSMATKKVRLIRVSVKAGYRVFLQDMSQKQ